MASMLSLQMSPDQRAIFRLMRWDTAMEWAAGAEEARDYLADDGRGLYYAGDFCSRRNPGFEAAALSAMDAAEAIRAQSASSLAK